MTAEQNGHWRLSSELDFIRSLKDAEAVHGYIQGLGVRTLGFQRNESLTDVQRRMLLQEARLRLGSL
jgi:hypothetical protein